MRITEKCCCGATFEVEWPGSVGTETDRGDSMQAVNSWRDRHRSCLPSHPALGVDDRPGLSTPTDALKDMRW